ncbi:uncharacterized protein [Arachis hypogaea]|uniref:uncharacterized protein n=1 Tax=Arachis hypogaea TaxID=3818 RepID=UPI000DECCFBA
MDVDGEESNEKYVADSNESGFLEDDDEDEIIMLLIQSSSSVTIPILQGTLRQSYHFKLSHRKVWLAKQKAIAQIYGDWEDSYIKVLRLLQVLQSYRPGTTCDLSAHCKPFISVGGTHLYGKYGIALLIAVAQDGNSNILLVAFAIVDSETTESWSFFLTNLR